MAEPPIHFELASGALEGVRDLSILDRRAMRD
jgi:hypothetical protein